MTDHNVIELTNVDFRWPGQSAFSIRVPDFTVQAGQSVLLLGESGSGKSTLLSLIAGIVRPSGGTAKVAGVDIANLKASAVDRFRAENIGVIFQQFNLLPFATVADNITLPLRFAPERRQRATPASDTARELCTALGLPGDILQQKAGRLSVGQQQRVAVARALIGRPPIVIADEPTSALDSNTQGAFLKVLFDQQRRHNAALVMVSHDARLAEDFDRVIDLADIATTEREVA